MSSPSLAEPYSRRKLLQLRKYAKNSVHVNLSTMAENLVLFEEPQLPSPRARVPSYTAAQGTGLPPAHTRRPSNVARTNLGGIQGVLSPSIHAGNGLIATPPVAARRPRLENAEGPSRLKPSTSIGRLPNFQEELPLDPARPKHGPLRSDQASNWRQRDHPGGKDTSMDETPTHWDEDEDPPAINGKSHENHSYNGHGPKDSGLSSLNGFSADPLLSKRPLGSLFAVEDPLLSKRSFSSPGIPPDRQALESPKPQPQHQLFDPAIASLGSPGLPPGLQAPPPPLAQRLEEVLWQYRDPSGTVQGPFSALQMHEWYLHQYFAGDLFVKPQYQAHFETLDAWTLRLAPAHRDKPFLSAPPSHAPAASSLPSPSVSHHLGSVGHPVQSTHHPAYQASRVRQFTSNYDPFQATSSTGPIISHGSTYDPPQPLQQATDPWGVPLPRVKPTEPARTPSQDPFFQPQALQSAVASSTIRAESPLQALHASSVPVSRDAWQSFSRDSIDDKGPIGPQGVQAIGQPISRSVSSEHAPTESLLASLNELQDDDQIEDATHSATPPTPGKASPSENPAPIEKPAAPIKASVAPVQPTESPKSAKQQKKEAKKVNGGIHVTPSKVVVIPAGTPTKSAPPLTQSQPPAPAEDKKPVESPAAVPSAKLNAPWVAKESPAQPTHPAQPSLREIQAREAKEEQLRKAAEKKAKAAALAAEQAALAVKAAQEAEAAHITQSTNWTTKSNGASTPVWQSTGAASASPKTLKEIQEEEARQQQRRAQALKQAQANGPAAAAAALRGYARSVDPSKVTATAGAPWSTVGSSGKSVPSSQGTPAAATPRSVTATPVTVSKPATPVPASRPLSAKRLAASDKAEATNQPSAEFMRWCRSALQGLTVPMDEFIQMLLSFPVQADAGTLEIISDMVYANSPNLDGRRFAETFALKRKADAGMSLKGKQPQVPPAPPIVVRSAADAVKSQPKKEEVLPFKVVQGKKKR